MSVDFQLTTWRYIPEYRTLHNHRCENLKCQILCSVVVKSLDFIFCLETLFLRGFTSITGTVVTELKLWSNQYWLCVSVSHDAKMQVLWQHLSCCRSKLVCGLTLCSFGCIGKFLVSSHSFCCSILGYKLVQWYKLFVTK
jgi:hypothetical protein